MVVALTTPGDGEAHVGDKDVNGPLTLSAVNSINWARLMAQVVYYFYAALRWVAQERKIAFGPDELWRCVCRLCRRANGSAN